MFNYRSKNRKITPWSIAWAIVIIIASVPALIICAILDFSGWLFGVDKYDE